MAPNNSFKPNLLRYGNGVADKACHAIASTTQVGLTQALGLLATHPGEGKMTIGLALALAAVILSACMISYSAYAEQNGLPRGRWFYTEQPVFVGMAFLAMAAARIVYGANHDHFSWWWLAGAVAAFFVGPPLVLSTLKYLTQIAGIVVTPLLLLAALFVK
ncbi:hypothetical protein [Pseudoxanthomonas mexicana]